LHFKRIIGVNLTGGEKRKSKRGICKLLP